MKLFTRWLPRSLFGRLMLVLAAGLALAQGISAVINVAERDQLVSRSFGMQPVQRITDVVMLLDSLPANERQRVVAVFNLPPLVLSIHSTPVIAEAAAGSRRSDMFATRLRAQLGDGRPVRVEPRSGFAVDAGAMGGLWGWGCEGAYRPQGGR